MSWPPADRALRALWCDRGGMDGSALRRSCAKASSGTPTLGHVVEGKRRGLRKRNGRMEPHPEVWEGRPPNGPDWLHFSKRHRQHQFAQHVQLHVEVLAHSFVLLYRVYLSGRPPDARTSRSRYTNTSTCRLPPTAQRLFACHYYARLTKSNIVTPGELIRAHGHSFSLLHGTWLCMAA